ncbi:hypothetical protein [Mycolicibacterium canariasense]|uniref:hypothetical protein n=1 Tax=Mycolicibacterium canariasense TaxID=228230 RepID=UPI000788C0C3|nr:hypothetical protein [Mycolicibacterium canariasense]MCV7208761.1 hypothetical protein [Mycolicibacterium canariasense]ORV07171.1 hypothetical protein AWB94_14325 [Mycolicibacterium canariasense]
MDRLVAGGAAPGHVSVAARAWVAADDHLAGAELVAVRALGRPLDVHAAAAVRDQVADLGHAVDRSRGR